MNTEINKNNMNTEIAIKKWTPIIEKLLENVNKPKDENQVKFLCLFCEHYSILHSHIINTDHSMNNLPFALKRLVLTNIHDTDYTFVNRNTITELVKSEVLSETEQNNIKEKIGIDFTALIENKLGEAVDKQLALIDFSKYSNVTISKFMDIQQIGNQFVVFSKYDCFN